MDDGSRSATLPPAELVAQADWLRRLARALVGGDEAGAEDLVQSTMVIALAHPPAADRDVRPWFGKVLRNLARMQWRQRARGGPYAPDGDEANTGSTPAPPSPPRRRRWTPAANRPPPSRTSWTPADAKEKGSRRWSAPSARTRPPRARSSRPPVPRHGPLVQLQGRAAE